MEWPNVTYNGFYVGDEVQLPDGRATVIVEALVEKVWCWNSITKCAYQGSVVKLGDGSNYLDINLTRIG